MHDDGPAGLDRVRVAFDDERVVSDAGIALVASLAGRLEVEALAKRFVRLRRDRAAHLSTISRAPTISKRVQRILGGARGFSGGRGCALRDTRPGPGRRFSRRLRTPARDLAPWRVAV